jgi:hypothetical protein
MFLKSWSPAALVALALFAGACATTQNAAQPPPEDVTPAAQPVQPTPAEEEDPTALAAQLQKLDASADGFTVLFPGQPSAERQTVPTPSGELQTATWAMKIEGVYYSINITDNPEKNIKATSSQKFLEAVRAQLVGQLKGTLDSEEQITLQGFPGRAYTVSSPNGQMKARNYLVGNRLYTLFVISPDGYAPGGDRFLGSLQLINPPPAPETAAPKPATEPAAPKPATEPAAPAPAPTSDTKSP